MFLSSNSGGEDFETMKPVLIVSGRSDEHFTIAIRLTQLGGILLSDLILSASRLDPRIRYSGRIARAYALGGPSTRSQSILTGTGKLIVLRPADVSEDKDRRVTARSVSPKDCGPVRRTLTNLFCFIIIYSSGLIDCF